MTEKSTRSNNNAGWRDIGSRHLYFRSRWEAQYARYLQWQKEQGLINDWEHEPFTFWFLEIKRGVRSYLPDFKVWAISGQTYWVEVKGWMDPKSATKLKRMRIYYPHEEVRIVEAAWFRRNNAMMRNLIKEWE